MGIKWIHQIDNEGFTPLDRALESDHMSIAELMLRQDWEGPYEVSLHQAVKDGHVPLAEKLLELHDVNGTDDEGMTPLHWGCLTGDADMVRLLLENGGDTCRANAHADGLTPEDMAVAMGYREVIRAMRERACLV
jgi:ankyrin repeat protein